VAERQLLVEQKGDVAVVRFTCKVLDESVAHLVGQELYDLVAAGHRRVLLDFANVEFLNSTVLGKLITLHKKLRSADGELKLCSLQQQILDIFAITRLDRVFDIQEDETAGLAAFDLTR
jgi:anti-sigma B factor antagonist